MAKLRWHTGYVHDSDPNNITIDYDADWEGCCENCESDLDVSFRTKTDENGKADHKATDIQGMPPKKILKIIATKTDALILTPLRRGFCPVSSPSRNLVISLPEPSFLLPLLLIELALSAATYPTKNAKQQVSLISGLFIPFGFHLIFWGAFGSGHVHQFCMEVLTPVRQTF